MVVADHPCDLPATILEAPEMNELCLSDYIAILGADVVETMNPDLHRAVALDWVYLQ